MLFITVMMGQNAFAQKQPFNACGKPEGLSPFVKGAAGKKNFTFSSWVNAALGTSDKPNMFNGTQPNSPEVLDGSKPSNRDVIVNRALIPMFRYYGEKHPGAGGWNETYGTGREGVEAVLQANATSAVYKPIPQGDSIRMLGFDKNGDVVPFTRAPYPGEYGWFDYMFDELLISDYCGNAGFICFTSTTKVAEKTVTEITHVTVYDTIKVAARTAPPTGVLKVDTLHSGGITIYLSNIGNSESTSSITQPVAAAPAMALTTTTTAPAPVYMLPWEQQAVAPQQTVVQQVKMAPQEVVYTDGCNQYVRRGVDWYKVADITLGLANLGLNIHQTVRLEQMRRMGTYGYAPNGTGTIIPSPSPSPAPYPGPTAGGPSMWPN